MPGSCKRGGSVLSSASQALFQSDSEIDHIFRVFRLLGTPSISSWPELVGMKCFSPKFPVYSRIDLAQVTRAACCGGTADGERLVRQAQSERAEVLQHVMGVAGVLGPDGMFALDSLLTLPPSSRAGADALLASAFLSGDPLHSGPGPHPRTTAWLHADPRRPPEVGLLKGPPPKHNKQVYLFVIFIRFLIMIFNRTLCCISV